MSNSVATQEKRYIKLFPSNNSATFGPSGSQPVIRFSIADTQALCLLSQCRLNFTLLPYRTGTTLPLYTDDFNVDGCVANCSIMDQVIISSRRFGQTIEQVMNLGRLESAYYRSKYSPKMMAANHYNTSKACGLGRYNRFDGSFVSTSTHLDVRNMMQRKAALAAKYNEVALDQTAGTPCSVPFHSGTFLSKPLDLNSSGGLEIALFLTKMEGMFYGTGTNPPTSASSYYMTNVSLTVPLLYKSSQMIANTPPESIIEFLNWTSLYSVLDSTVSSISHRLYLSGLTSAMHSMLPTGQINNVSYNQYGLKNPVVQRLTMTRDGARFPLEKTCIVQENTTATATDASTTYPEILTDYMSSWSPPKDQIYSQVIPENVKGLQNRSGVFSVGCNYSPDSSGVPINGVLGLDIQSKIYEISGTTIGTEPYALYSFYLARTAFATTPMGMKSL